MATAPATMPGPAARFSPAPSPARRPTPTSTPASPPIRSPPPAWATARASRPWNRPRHWGGNARRKLDQYLSGVREVEQRITHAAQLSPITVPDDFSRPAGVPADLTDHIRLMCDLMVLAFQTDVTRIASFMI